MAPKMIVIAGPPGGGKSTAFPVAGFDIAFFNGDDRAAELNGGSYVGISNQIRQVVNREFEEFVLRCIQNRTSFAIETTLRTAVTFEQARLAKAAGFSIEMRYLALRDLPMHLERVKARADAGGHSASETTLSRIYRSSLGNLAQAVAKMDALWVYDNSVVGGPPQLVMEARGGVIRFLISDPPGWLVTALEQAREIAHVLFIGVEGSIGRLEKIVKNTREFQKAHSRETVVPLVAWDEIALVFLEDVAAPALCAREILAVVRNDPNITARMGVHSGSATRRTDIRGHVNFSGDAIQFAQQAMERAGAGQIVVTGAVLKVLAPVPAWTDCFDSLDQHLETRPGEGLELYSLRQDDRGEVEVAIEGDNWVAINSAAFFMGAQNKDADGPNYDLDALPDELLEETHLAAFEIGRYPVTVREYGQFVDELGEPENWQEQQLQPGWPVVGVTLSGAAAYCTKANVRLPTGAEWERAARGADGRKYPWGIDPPDPTRANYVGGPSRPTRVGSYQGGSTPEGVYDMAGNVWEWVADWSGEVRGGSCYSIPSELRAAYRLKHNPDVPDAATGFRCARGGS